ncbi:MAG TPA: hypothetical protein VMF58_15535 [Rhizomicrobium sp.]|nr:hypothetical protein [Rhizomicrobium sp.]
MREYEMRLHRPNGVLSVVMKTLAIDDNDARRAASQYLIGDIAWARIFSDEEAVGVVQRILSVVQNRCEPSQPPFAPRESAAALVA